MSRITQQVVGGKKRYVVDGKEYRLYSSAVLALKRAQRQEKAQQKKRRTAKVQGRQEGGQIFKGETLERGGKYCKTHPAYAQARLGQLHGSGTLAEAFLMAGFEPKMAPDGTADCSTWVAKTDMDFYVILEIGETGAKAMRFLGGDQDVRVVDWHFTRFFNEGEEYDGVGAYDACMQYVITAVRQDNHRAACLQGRAKETRKSTLEGLWNEVKGTGCLMERVLLAGFTPAERDGEVDLLIWRAPTVRNAYIYYQRVPNGYRVYRDVPGTKSPPLFDRFFDDRRRYKRKGSKDTVEAADAAWEVAIWAVGREAEQEKKVEAQRKAYAEAERKREKEEVELKVHKKQA